jgi:hypothetical protein
VSLPNKKPFSHNSCPWTWCPPSKHSWTLIMHQSLLHPH